MNSTASRLVKVGLLLIILFLAYRLYAIIQDPINFENLKEKRYTAIQEKLGEIRDVQKAFRTEYRVFAPDLNALIAFVDTGKIAIIERKDSSFMYYNKKYQTDMEKDTVVITLLGYEPVKEKLFNKDFVAESLRYIPFTNNTPFEVEASKLKVNQVVLPVFVARAPNSDIFYDVLDKYSQYIDEDYALEIGSLTEPTLSGNWK
jgi:hypothetical protein